MIHGQNLIVVLRGKGGLSRQNHGEVHAESRNFHAQLLGQNQHVFKVGAANDPHRQHLTLPVLNINLAHPQHHLLVVVEHKFNGLIQFVNQAGYACGCPLQAVVEQSIGFNQQALGRCLFFLFCCCFGLRAVFRLSVCRVLLWFFILHGIIIAECGDGLLC